MANSFASTSLTATVGLLQNYYAGGVVTQFNDSIPWYKAIEKGSEKYQGLQVVRAVKVRRNPGIGATSDGGSLPSIGTQTTVNATIAAKFNYLRFGLTGPMLKAAASSKNAFASIFDYEMKEGMNDMKSDVNRQFFWDGSGKIAQLNAAVSGSSVITVIGRDGANEEGSKYVDVGMVVDIYTSAGVLVASGLTINAVSGTTTATLTLSAVVTASSGDILVRSGAYGNEIQGLGYNIDGGTGTIYGINRTTYAAFQSTLSDLGAQALSLNGIQTPYNEARRLGDAKIDGVYSDFDTERFYNKLLIADKRYQGKVKGDGTFSDKNGSYLEWAGTPWVPDKDCPRRIFFLDSSTWKKYVLSELEWADETGSYMIAQAGADAWEVRLRLFANLFCEKQRANSAATNYISP